MTSDRLTAEFVASSGGSIFLLLREPEVSVADPRCVLFVPPFAEEMNKCRRQVMMTAAAAVRKGMTCLVVDLAGTGDSEGEFGAVSWEVWKGNLQTAADWISRRSLALDAIVATRLGCVLAAEWLKEARLAVRKSVFWQPVISGRQYAAQFLRLRVASTMMEAGPRETVGDLRDRINAGEVLEVAGYTLNPDLWKGLEQVDLVRALDPGLGTLRVFELGSGSDACSPPVLKFVEAARLLGIESASVRLEGAPFWSATEIVTNADLERATVEFLAA